MSTGRSVMQMFARSSLQMALLYAASTGLSFLSGVVVANLLGATGYGLYAIALSISTLAGLAAEFGLPTLAMREAGRGLATGEWGLLKGLVAWSDQAILLLCMLIVLALASVVSLGLIDTGHGLLRILPFGLLLIPFVSIGKVRAFALLGLDHVLASQLPVVVGRPLLFIAGCGGAWLVWERIDPAMAMAAQAASAACAMVVSLVLYRRLRPVALVKASPDRDVRAWLESCVPMAMSEGLRLLQGQLALLLVGLLAGVAQAGTYRVADAVSQVTLVLVSAIATAGTPMFARLHAAGDREGLQNLASLCTVAMLGGAFFVGLPIALWGDHLIPLVFGSNFASSAVLFRILWAGLLVSATLGMPLSIANMTGHHALSTRSFLIMGVANASLGALLIPHFGAAGGALATSAALLIATAYCSLRLHAATGIDTTLYGLRHIHKKASVTGRKL